MCPCLLGGLCLAIGRVTVRTSTWHTGTTCQVPTRLGKCLEWSLTHAPAVFTPPKRASRGWENMRHLQRWIDIHDRVVSIAVLGKGLLFRCWPGSLWSSLRKIEAVWPAANGLALLAPFSPHAGRAVGLSVMPRSTSTISPRRRSLPRSEHRTPAGHLGCTCQRACIWNGGICRPCRRPDESQTSNTSRSPSLAPMYPIALTHMHREASPDPQSPEKPRPGLLGLPGPACSTPPAAFSNLTGPRLYIKRRSAQQLQQATPGFGVEHDGRPSKTDLPLLLPMAIYEMAALFLHHIHA